jgi:hypothetical protein
MINSIIDFILFIPRLIIELIIDIWGSNPGISMDEWSDDVY